VAEGFQSDFQQLVVGSEGCPEARSFWPLGGLPATGGIERDRVDGAIFSAMLRTEADWEGQMLKNIRDTFFRPSATNVQIPGIGSLALELHSTGDRWISDVIRSGEVFDAHILAVLMSLAEPGMTMLDIGANLGWFSVIGSRLVGSGGRVFAIEPDPGNLRLLKRNLALNRCRNVTVLPMAAGAEAQTARLYRSPDNQGDHRLETTSDRPDSVSVKVRPIDEYLAGKRADLVKIDTQGSETSVLRGMRNVLAHNPRIRVVLEFWPFGLQRCGSSAAELLTLMDSRNCSLWLLRSPGSVEAIDLPGLHELASTQFAPETQAHADLVWLAADDEPAIEAMKQKALLRVA
jgi:FkbM family methyltransferase